MYINYPLTLDEISVKISELEHKIHLMDFILKESRLDDIGITLCSYSSEKRSFHYLRQDNFEFNLVLELTKLLLDNKVQLIQKIEEYQKLWRNTARNTF